jgi:oligopeptidase B
MRTNADGAADFKLLSAPLDALDSSEWREEAPHIPGRMIFNATVFADYLVWLERRDCRPRLVVRSRAGEERIVAFDQPCCHLRFAENFDYDRPILRLS